MKTLCLGSIQLNTLLIFQSHIDQIKVNLLTCMSCINAALSFYWCSSSLLHYCSNPESLWCYHCKFSCVFSGFRWHLYTFMSMNWPEMFPCNTVLSNFRLVSIKNMPDIYSKSLSRKPCPVSCLWMCVCMCVRGVVWQSYSYHCSGGEELICRLFMPQRSRVI